MGDLEKKDKYSLPVQWTFNNAAMEAVQKMNTASKATGKHGIIASIPIICRGNKCPYVETCPMKALEINVDELNGQRCPVEVSTIMRKFEEYIDYFNIDLDSVDHVVIGLIKELIDYEIQIERADNIMAKQGDFLEEVVVGISADGKPIKNKEIAKPVDYKERATKKKHDILQLLNSTPKDKAGQKLNITMDPSTYAAQLLAKAKDLQDVEIVDVDAIVEEDDK